MGFAHRVIDPLLSTLPLQAVGGGLKDIEAAIPKLIHLRGVVCDLHLNVPPFPFGSFGVLV